MFSLQSKRFYGKDLKLVTKAKNANRDVPKFEPQNKELIILLYEEFLSL